MTKLTSEKVADRLSHCAPEIMRQWETRVRAAVPAARRETQLVLRNSIPKFLDEMVQALAGHSVGQNSRPEAPHEHAEQRAELPGYSLEQVILEYSLLRESIFDVLANSGPINSGDLRVILNIIDLGIREASAHYVDLQEKALTESEERFRQLVSNVNDYAIFMLDASGTVVTWNQGVQRIKGYSAKELLGKHFSVLYTDEDRASGKPERGLKAAADNGRFEDLGLRVRKDGSTFFANVIITALRDNDGNLKGYTKITRDITERRAMEDELVKRTELLAAANRRKDEFLAMLAHELRNPLASIVTSAEIIRLRKLDDPAIAQAREVISRQGNHLARLVDDLLDVARITQDKITLHKEPVALERLIDQVVETLRPFLEDRRQSLAVDPPGSAVWIEADFVRMSQVLANLLHNSAKFSHRGDQILMRAWVENNRVLIAVVDHGAGIDPALLPHVFDLFTQGSTNHGSTPGGLGIGLTLARRLVEMHGGQISAHSEGLGKGSRFVIDLPALHVAMPLSTAPLNKEDRSHSDVAKKVLVVDDNLDAATSLGAVLELLGHEIQVVHCGDDALQALFAWVPDVVLLDIGLPDMDGYAVAARIKAQPRLRNVTLIALTGYGQAEDKQRARESGFDLHLTKPVDMAQLKAALDRCGTADRHGL